MHTRFSRLLIFVQIIFDCINMQLFASYFHAFFSLQKNIRFDGLRYICDLKYMTYMRSLRTVINRIQLPY